MTHCLQCTGGLEPELSDKALRRLKYETGTKESITQQLEALQQIDMKEIVQLVSHLHFER